MARRAAKRGRGPKLVSIEGGGDMPAERRSNVSDETRREYLDRGRLALALAEEKKQEWRSANGIYRQILKEAKRNGCTQIAWTLAMLKREPDDIAAEMQERNRMLVIAKIPVGVQLGMFEGHGETLAEVLERQNEMQAAAGDVTVAEVVKDTWEKEDAAPPKPKPDDEEDEDEDEGEDDEEGQDTKAGNEVLERNQDDAAAFKQGERAFQLGRTLDGCPYSSITSMSGAWIRGWRNKEAEQKVNA